MNLAPTPPACAREGVTLRVIRSAEELETVRGAWEALEWHPNADIDFYLMINAIRSHVLRPHVVLLERENGQALAMLIGRIERVALECRIGYLRVMRPEVRALTVVYGGVLGEAAEAHAAALAGELAAALRRGEADVARLSGLTPESELYREVLHRAAPLCRDRLVRPAPHWRISLPGSFEEFLQRFKSKRRSEIRRMERLFEKTFPGRVCHRIFRAEAEAEELCRDAEAVARRTYQRGMEAGFVGDEEHLRRMRLAAARGWLRAYLVYLDDQPCAFEIGLLYRGVFHLEYTGYDPALRKYEVGTLVFMKMIADLCGSEAGQIDCGLGDAAYKRQYGDRCWQECAPLMFAPTLRGRAINTVRTLTLTAGGLAGAVSRRLRLEGRIKRLWRTVLARGTSYNNK